ncbi:MAG: hypothetical protein M3437_02180 [Chloroflexota bacterium]|nr:hypothetical protein [Chloroflexota bacterium]MDQ5866071.1 hypothetical protein [Chloroflexota bacterium]
MLVLVAVTLMMSGNNQDLGSDFLSEIREQSRASQISATVATGIIGAAISLPLAIGLWRLRPWARVMALVVYAGGAGLTLCANFNEALTISMLVRLAIAAWVVYYLLQPDVSSAFGELD